MDSKLNVINNITNVFVLLYLNSNMNKELALTKLYLRFTIKTNYR